ncbi:MAG: cupin domain-containing protein [Nitrolancea sp.]
MISFQLDALEVGDFWQEENPTGKGRGSFPLTGVTGVESTGMVYFEIDPGNNLPLHTDSPDELIIVLSGTARATIGDEEGELQAGSVAFIPSMAPHGFENVGNETLRCVGVFPDSNVVTTFEYAMQPFGTRILKFKDMVPA